MTILKSKVDTNKYVSKTLKNGIKALIVQNDVFTKSSCALTVNVGSFDEPDQFPGLAHFLEHMLFMGTAKYPGENMFSDFLSQHNGYSNAYTADEITTYYCDIDSEYFSKMADMFAQFFIAPLFKKDTVEREISAVDSEFLNTLNNREWRIHALFTDLMKDDRKEKRFSCGNSETLRRENSLDAVINFWKTMYSSDLMSIVICGNKSVEELENILELFENIPNRSSAVRSSTDTNYNPAIISSTNNYNSAVNSSENQNVAIISSEKLFKNEILSKIVKFKPLDDKKEILIRTILCPLRDRFKVNPLEFISFQLTKKERGGLLHILKTKKLAFDLSFEYAYFSQFTDIRIQISLTDKGMAEFQTVLNILSLYLSKMNLDENEYSRLKKLEEEDFDFKPCKTPVEIAEETCPDLLFYPFEYVLKHEYVFEDFDSQLINSCLKSIQDTSKWVILLSDANESFNMMEKYYSVEYCVKEDAVISQDASVVEFKIPLNTTDQFIDEIKVIESEERYIKRQVFDDGEVNLVFDSQFNVPKCELYILLSSPEMRMNPLPYQIFFLMINDSFHDKYARFLTNIHVDVSVEFDITGIFLKFEGFSSRLIEVCKLFFELVGNMETTVDKYENFDVIRQEVEDFYSEITVQSPCSRLFEVFNSKITSSKTSEKLLEESRTISKEALKNETKFYTKVFAVGNIEYDQIISMYEAIRSHNVKPSMEINNKELVVEFETPDKFNNGVAILYKINDSNLKEADDYKTNDSNNKEEYDYESNNKEKHDYKTNDCNNKEEYDYNTAVGNLIHQIAQERFFNELRTIEEFGYIVYCAVRSFQSAEYLSFVVQSEKPVDFIEKRIIKFVEDLKIHISEMDDEEFENHRESLIGFYEEPILNLSDFSKVLLRRFFKNRLDLNYEKVMIEKVKKLSRKDILSSGVFNSYIRVNSIKKE